MFAAAVAVVGLVVSSVVPTWGGHTAEEWERIGELVAAAPPTWGGLTEAEWLQVGELVAALPAPVTVETIVEAAADEFGVSRLVLSEIVRCESGFDPGARNPSSGAAGLGQHLPRYWPGRAVAVGYGPDADPFDATINARVTAWLLATSGTAPWAPWSGHCSPHY